MDDFALDPQVKRSSGYYNAHVKLLLGREHGDPSLTYVQAPMYDKRNACRTSVSIPIMRPSECVSDHFLGHQDAVDRASVVTPLPLVRPEAPWTERESNHQVVRQRVAEGFHLSRTRRVGFFMDDAGFTKNESFHAIYLNDVSTGQRFLTAIIRKAEVCQAVVVVSARTGAFTTPYRQIWSPQRLVFGLRVSTITVRL